MKMTARPLLAAAMAALIAVAAFDPVAAMPMAGLKDVPPPDLVMISDHHDHHHWHRGHQRHGSDNYYDRDDDSGVLFKSFVTGTLFSHQSQADGTHASACAARYRSYDAASNTYQPSRGPRRQCH